MQPDSPPVAVLNPAGNDPQQHFPDFAGRPGGGSHAPVNHHAFAACTAGAFYRDSNCIPASSDAVLILLHDLERARRAEVELLRAGKTVAVTIKETGAMQVAELLADARRMALFEEICRAANGALATTEDSIPLYEGAGAKVVEFIPTPYPIDDPRWDFSKSPDASSAAESTENPFSPKTKGGIFIGTRQFKIYSRNHLAALLAVRPLAEATENPVTVINRDGPSGAAILAALHYPAGLLRVIDGLLPYHVYLRRMAECDLVFQLDSSKVPGQVAGDAILCRIPCVGGNGTIERIASPELSGVGKTTVELLRIVEHLLAKPEVRRDHVSANLLRAGRHFSFAEGARQLGGFFARLQGHAGDSSKSPASRGWSGYTR